MSADYNTTKGSYGIQLPPHDVSDDIKPAPNHLILSSVIRYNRNAGACSVHPTDVRLKNALDHVKDGSEDKIPWLKDKRLLHVETYLPEEAFSCGKHHGNIPVDLRPGQDYELKTALESYSWQRHFQAEEANASNATKGSGKSYLHCVQHGAEGKSGAPMAHFQPAESQVNNSIVSENSLSGPSSSDNQNQLQYVESPENCSIAEKGCTRETAACSPCQQPASSTDSTPDSMQMHGIAIDQSQEAGGCMDYNNGMETRETQVKVKSPYTKRNRNRKHKVEQSQDGNVVTSQQTLSPEPSRQNDSGANNQDTQGIIPSSGTVSQVPSAVVQRYRGEVLAKNLAEYSQGFSQGENVLTTTEGGVTTGLGSSARNAVALSYWASLFRIPLSSRFINGKINYEYYKRDFFAMVEAEGLNHLFIAPNITKIHQEITVPGPQTRSSKRAMTEAGSPSKKQKQQNSSVQQKVTPTRILQPIKYGNLNMVFCDHRFNGLNLYGPVLRDSSPSKVEHMPQDNKRKGNNIQIAYIHQCPMRKGGNGKGCFGNNFNCETHILNPGDLKKLPVGGGLIISKQRNMKSTEMYVRKHTSSFDYLLDLPTFAAPDESLGEDKNKCVVAGVYWDKRSWIASWYDGGTRHYNSFSARMHGFYRAQYFAIQVRLFKNRQKNKPLDYEAVERERLRLIRHYRIMTR